MSLPNSWGIDLSLLKSDVTDPHLGGNKYHKLVAYLEEARRSSILHLMTMAGAHSNHLRAFAALTYRENIEACAFIRGDELSNPERHSEEIRFAIKHGVECFFLNRTLYRALRETKTHLERSVLLPQFDFNHTLFIPEGGLGVLGVQGVVLWAKMANDFDNIYLPCATGTTAAGFLLGTKSSSKIVGVSVLKNAAAIREAIHLLAPGEIDRFELMTDFTMASFNRTSPEIIALCNEFSQLWKLPIDTVYLGKVLLALKTNALAGKIRGRVLLVYTYNV